MATPDKHARAARKGEEAPRRILFCLPVGLVWLNRVLLEMPEPGNVNNLTEARKALTTNDI